MLKSARDVRKLLSDLISVDLGVVCLFGYRGWVRVLTALVARQRRRPLVVRSDSNMKSEEQRPKWRRVLKRIYLRLLLGNAEVWTIGTGNARYWSSLGFRRQALIPYVVPIPPSRSTREEELLRPVRDCEFVVAYVGRLHPVKGVNDLISAWTAFRTDLPQARIALLICGSGELDERVRDFAVSEPTCYFLKALTHAELGSVYARCDVLVVPSRMEAWGLVVNEALAYGARVVASDQIGAADDLIDASNGQRFPAGDVAALTKCLKAEFSRDRSRPIPPTLPDVAAMMQARLGINHRDMRCR